MAAWLFMSTAVCVLAVVAAMSVAAVVKGHCLGASVMMMCA